MDSLFSKPKFSTGSNSCKCGCNVMYKNKEKCYYPYVCCNCGEELCDEEVGSTYHMNLSSDSDIVSKRELFIVLDKLMVNSSKEVATVLEGLKKTIESR